jgi:3-oxoacyl-[acyl-carrier-protein] synthase II
MMQALLQDIVITGVGIVSPMGIGRTDFWEAILRRQSGVRTFGETRFGEYPLTFGGTLPGFDPKLYVKPRKAIKLMCREIQTGYAAATLAVEDAALDVKGVDSDRFGVVLGSEMLYGDPDDLIEIFANAAVNGQCDTRQFGDRISHDMFPLWMLNFLPNMPACHVGIAQQAFGANNSIVQGDASSLLAIAEAVSVIRRGWCDVMICGGTGNRINVTHRIHITTEMLSQREQDPQQACRPFDVDRDGEVLGEGAAALVIETRSHAESRGAKPLARILGFGSTFGATAGPYQGATTEAMENAIRVAIERSGCEKSEIDHVNAHGCSRRDWDCREAAAIGAQLKGVPVMAPKSYFGNLGAGSGTVEAATSILALAEGHVPGTLNLEHTDPACPIDVIGPAGKACERPLAILLNQSTTGQSVAVVIGKP